MISFYNREYAYAFLENIPVYEYLSKGGGVQLSFYWKKI